MLIQITVKELIIFLFSALGIIAGSLLLPILWNIKKIVSILRSLLETNREYINKTVKTMPETFENVEQISINVREITDKFKISVPVILQEVEVATNAAKGSIELAGVVIENMGSEINETISTYKKDTSGFMAYFHIIDEVVQILYRTFSSKK